MFKLAPSILAADFADLGNQVALIEKGGADFIHIDVMDGHFVPNISYGPAVMKSVKDYSDLSYDVHLMIEDPDKYIEDFVTEKTRYITVHQEACVHLNRTIEHIKACKVGAGVSLNPATPLGTLEEVLGDVDLVLIMSVNPGFGGQEFIEASMDKIKRLSEIRKEKGYSFLIEVDGGVTLGNALALAKAGADILVAGSAVFEAKDIAGRVKEFKALGK